jgi:hypothetical protein
MSCASAFVPVPERPSDLNHWGCALDQGVVTWLCQRQVRQSLASVPYWTVKETRPQTSRTLTTMMRGFTRTSTWQDVSSNETRTLVLRLWTYQQRCELLVGLCFL